MSIWDCSVALRRSSSPLRACRSSTAGGASARCSSGRLVQASSVWAIVSNCRLSEVRVTWAWAIHSSPVFTPGAARTGTADGTGADAVTA
ncbi:hypothetical protein CFP66_04175 [Pseudonocardia sp. MH-G8]|nr:hypothetical protein CFP66_04175 [Pseudonocardia sp. MH-G8]